MALMKRDGVLGDLLYRRRGGTAGRANASIVERDHVMRRRETINNPRVPVVQDGSQVDEEHHRDAGIVRPQFPIRELHAACGDRSRWHVVPMTCSVCDVLILLSRANVITVFTLTGAFHVSDTTTLPFARPAST
jgi:hypothetical protein